MSNSNSSKKIIGFPGKRTGIGGPATFQKRLIEQLNNEGWEVVYPSDGILPDIIFINGGATSQTFWILRSKLKGSKVVHRTANLFWKHKVKWNGFKKYIEYTYNNLVIRWTRNFLADHVIYQSDFAFKFFKKKIGISNKEQNSLIYNGTNIKTFFPSKSIIESKERPISIVCIEGTIENEEFTYRVLDKVSKINIDDKEVIINIYGRSVSEFETKFKNKENVKFNGLVKQKEIPSILQQHDIFLSLEINGACPNAIIEAMSCGLPVISFDTGAAKELIKEEGGLTLPYKGDYWKLEPPEIENELEKAIQILYANLKDWKLKARKNVEEHFDSKIMAKNYINTFDQLLNQ